MKRHIYFMSLAIILAGCSSPENQETPSTEANTAPTEQTETVDIVSGDISETEIEVKTSTIRQADSHVHGGATLALALDGTRITAELETPLYNLLGFEHLPETESQFDAVTDAEARLKEPNQLIRFNSEAGCEATTMTTDIHLFEEGKGHKDHHDKEAHHEEEHSHDDHAEDESDHEHHDDGEGHEHHDDEEHENHRDVILEYGFNCSSPSELRRVTVDMLSLFPLMTELDVVYLGPDRQASFELTPSDRTAALRP